MILVAHYTVCCRLLEMGPKLEQLVRDIQDGVRPITKVDLSNEGLTSFPDALYAIKDDVEFINFGGNQLSSLPDEIAQFSNLKILFFANNNFTAIPECLGLLPSIRMLSFKSNRIAEIPEASLSSSIKWLILTDNQISGTAHHFMYNNTSKYQFGPNTTSVMFRAA